MTLGLRVGRVALRALETLAYLLGGIAVAILLRQLLFSFLLLTLGLPGMRLGNALRFLALNGLPTLRELRWFVAFLLPGACLLLIRLARARGEWSAVLAAQVLVAFVALACSYRLLAFAAFLALLYFQRRSTRPDGRRSLTWAALALIVVVAALPVDFSLQFVPGSPRFVPAVSGLLTGAAFQHAAAGRYVIVGNDLPLFNEPSWVWVW